MKKTIYTWPAILSALLVSAFFIWALLQRDTAGMLHVNYVVRIVFIVIAIIATAAVPTAWVASTFKSRGRARLGQALAVFALILSLPGLLGAPAAFAVMNSLIPYNIGDTPPQLFLANSTGLYGLPDLALTFNTAKLTQNTVTWGKVIDTAGTAIAEPTAGRTHAFLLTNLEPDTDYYYRLEGSEACIFRTADPAGTLRFAVGCDAHYGVSQYAEARTMLLSQIANPENAFSYFFLVGDTTHWGFSKSQWREAFNELSKVSAAIPIYLAPGNHDTMFAGFDNYLRYAYPGSPTPDNNKASWGRLDVGHAHFLIIDLGWSAEAFTDEQAAWLENELQSIPDSDWKIVLGHVFTYASGQLDEGSYRYDNPETIVRLVPLFEKYGVDLVFSGHNHQMEVLEKSGVSYILSSPFGGTPESPRTYLSPYSLWHESGRHGFVEVSIADGKAEMVFRAPDGSEIYRYSLAKSTP